MYSIDGTEFLNLSAKHLKTIIKEVRKMNPTYSYESIEETLHDRIIHVFDRIERKKVKFIEPEKALTYLSLATHNEIKNVRKKDSHRHKIELDFGTKNYSNNGVYDFLLDNSVTNLYELIMNYVYDNYSFLHAGIFKAKNITDLSFSQVATMVGKPKSTVFSINRRIHQDVKGFLKKLMVENPFEN